MLHWDCLKMSGHIKETENKPAIWIALITSKRGVTTKNG